jgi:hypothetical protein
MADLQEFQETWQHKIDELWAWMRESKKQDEERAREQAREQAERAKEQAERDREQAREQAEQAKSEAEHTKKQAELNRLIEETARQMKETDRQMKETDRKLGELGNRFGELAEHLVAPNIKEKFNALGYNFAGIFQDCEIDDANGESVEVDILLENETHSIAVEVKAKPKDQDIDRHISRLEFLRRHKDRLRDSRKLLGAIAGAIMSDSVRNYALKAGLYVIEQTGDTVKIDTPQGFVPGEW